MGYLVLFKTKYLGDLDNDHFMRLTKNIELVCNRAKESEKELFLFRREMFPQNIPPEESHENEDEAFLIDLPDGGKARVKLPEELV